MIRSGKILNGLFVVILLSTHASLPAQDTLQIGLSELLSRAHTHNRQLDLISKDIRSAKIDADMSKAIYLPIVNLENSGAFTTNPLNAFGFKLQEQKISQADFNPVLLNDPDMTELFTTKVEVQQPILNLDGIHARKAALSQVEAVQYQLDRATKNIDFEIAQTYHQLMLLYESVGVIESARQTAIENLNLTQNMLEQGYVKQADELEVRLHISDINNQMLSLSNNIRVTSQLLNYLMGSDEDVIIKPVDKIELNESVQKADLNLLNNRSDILAYDKGVEAHHHMIRSQKMKRMPRLNAMGNYQWNDDSFLGFSGGSYTLGFNISWNIFNGNQNISSIKKSEIELEKTIARKQDVIARSKMEVLNEFRRLDNIKDKLRVLELAIEHAEESLRIRTNLYEQGLERTTDVLMAETNLSGKKLEYLSNVTEYNIVMAKITFLLENGDL